MSAKLRFIRHLEKNGYFVSVVSIGHLGELGAEVRSLHDKGLLDDTFYGDYAEPFFIPEPPKRLPRAKSIIVVAVPQPMLRATFSWGGQAMQFIIPPTYSDYHKTFRSVRNMLTDAFRPEPLRFVKAVLPLKLLAVRSGLALYGRNNITYVPEYGSFHRLMAFYSDYDSPEDYWQEKESLPLCAKCEACLVACPTNAIQKDRFLIRAERCLSYLNEKDSEHRFPPWVGASAHNCIVGCMRCQLACPYDRNMVGWSEDREEFSEEETAYLLKGRFSGARAERIEKKLKKVGLDLTLFPRNLEVLLNRRPK